MDHAAAFAHVTDSTVSAWAGTGFFWVAVCAGLLSFGFLLDGVIEREPEVVGPSAMLVVVALCAFYLAGRLG